MATADRGSKPLTLPGHLDLPSEDGTFVKNMREHPQSILITEAILPVLRGLHPDGLFAIGQDTGIYWRLTEPRTRGAVSPDWFYVAGVTPNLDGQYRRSYVLWKEPIPPRVVLEFASEDGSEERDATPGTGKFWIYEQRIRPPFYGIFVVTTGEFEAYHLVDGRYRRIPPNDRGRISVLDLGVDLGTWDGYFLNEDAPWLRWWDRDGQILPHSAELAAIETRRANDETRRADFQARRADDETRRAEALAARLRALGIDPDEVAGPR